MFYITISQILVSVVITFLSVWYCYYRFCFTYWKSRGVPSPTPAFPAGNITMSLLGQKSIYVLVQEHYRNYKSKGHIHAGLYFFNSPIYLPIDPELIRNICTVHFEHFTDRGGCYDEIKYPLTANLFTMEGKKWKELRAKLTPTFSSGKLKVLYGTAFMSNTKNLIDILGQKADGNTSINVKRILTSFAIDVVMSSVFGIEGQAKEDTTSSLANIAVNFFNTPLWLYLLTMFEGAFKNPGNILKLAHRQKHVEDYFYNLVDEMMKLRENENIKRNDFFSLLLKVKNQLTSNEIVGHAFMFFLGGFETSSHVIAYTMHELAHNQKIQDELRAEINENLGEDFTKYTYEGVINLPYLDRVVKETLRLYPVLGFLNRICTKDYPVPGTDVIIERGTPVLISTLGLQRDPEHFQDPLTYNPDRFSEDNSHIPFTYLPFGEGPRICPGIRFGQLVVKLAIAAIFSRFRTLPCENTPRVVEFDKFTTGLGMVRREGLSCKLSKL